MTSINLKSIQIWVNKDGCPFCKGKSRDWAEYFRLTNGVLPVCEEHLMQIIQLLGGVTEEEK